MTVLGLNELTTQLWDKLSTRTTQVNIFDNYKCLLINMQLLKKNDKGYFSSENSIQLFLR